MKRIFENYPQAVLLLKVKLIILESKITLQRFQPPNPGFSILSLDFLKFWSPVWNGDMPPLVPCGGLTSSGHF